MCTGSYAKPRVFVFTILASIVAVCSGYTPARAQAGPDAFLSQQRRIEEEVRSNFDRDVPADRKIELDWGGWYSFNLFLYDDGLESSRTYRRHDLRLWTSLNLDQGAHQLYARGKLQYEDFNSGDSYDRDDNDWIGPNLDRAFYQFDLRNAMKAYRGENLDWNLRVKVGRDYVEFGTGYALSSPLDHVKLTLELKDWEIIGLAGKAIRSTDNLDLSHPNSTNSERNFYGAQVTYTGFEKHTPFAYVFWNEDQHSEQPPIPFQEYDYDSWYVGIGSNGELIRNLRYGAELVLERGNSFGDLEFMKRDDIEAWAFDFELDYMTQRPMRPRFGGFGG